MQNLIHFNRAIKKLLRDKANFVVLNQQIKILEILLNFPKSEAI